MTSPILPKWATDDVQNSISQQYNVVPPPEGKKLLGWNYKEKPSRQWANWLARQTYLCLVDLRARVAAIVTDLGAPGIPYAVTFSGLNGVTSTGYYSVQGNKVFVQISVTIVNNTLTTPISFNLPLPSITDGTFLQHINVNRASPASRTLPGTGTLSAQIQSNSSTALLWGENTTNDPTDGGKAGQISGNATPGDDDGQLSIYGFYYAQIP